jgi:hypothetical protein
VIFVLAVAFVFAVAGTATVWRSGQLVYPHGRYMASDLTGSFFHLFTSRYPANVRFQTELDQMRATGKLKLENETLIRKTTLSAAAELRMPPAILWCLLFQESRLDHLAGMQEGKGVSGLGQFTFASYYEVNFHLDRYGQDNRRMLLKMLGGDVRPVGAFRENLSDPSSYYYIPTAVAASAAYLNNRYLQLQSALDRKGITYDPGLLWLYAAMAYNKGGRTVFAMWNDAAARGGKKEVQRLVSDRLSFFHALDQSGDFERILGKIWPEEDVAAYAHELKIHTERMRDCAISAEDRLRTKGGELGRH